MRVLGPLTLSALLLAASTAGASPHGSSHHADRDRGKETKPDAKPDGDAPMLSPSSVPKVDAPADPPRSSLPTVRAVDSPDSAAKMEERGVSWRPTQGALGALSGALIATGIGLVADAYAIGPDSTLPRRKVEYYTSFACFGAGAVIGIVDIVLTIVDSRARSRRAIATPTAAPVASRGDLFTLHF